MFLGSIVELEILIFKVVIIMIYLVGMIVDNWEVSLEDFYKMKWEY